MKKFMMEAGVASLDATPKASAGWRMVTRFLADAFEAVAAMAERAHQRRALANLDDRLLSDVGLSRDVVRRECDKPLWRD